MLLLFFIWEIPFMTINDIATLAGVSKSTVSRVLNNASNVNEKTRQLVLKVMKENNYVPSCMARALNKNKNNVIGLILPDVDSAFFGAIVHGINDVLKKTDYTILLCCTDNNPQDELHALYALRQQRVSGLFLTTSSSFATPKDAQMITNAVRDIKAPVVLIDRIFPNTSWDGVYSDNFSGAYSAVRTLIECGYRKIGAYISDMKLQIGQERYNGFQLAMSDANIPIDKKYLFLDDFSVSHKDIYDYTCQQIQKNNLPDAIFLSNRIITKGFFKAIFENGIVPGKDIHCIGFDYSDLIDILNIPYSYLERNLNLFGQTSAHLLLSRKNNESPVQRNYTIPATLHIHESLAKQHVKNADII